jgi:hypothetical protein
MDTVVSISNPGSLFEEPSPVIVVVVPLFSMNGNTHGGVDTAIICMIVSAVNCIEPVSIAGIIAVMVKVL